jgi:hypothetical protein
MLSQDFKEFVELLNQNKLIVGGYAVGLKDMDDLENIE